ncbi:RICIN domain-containing protein [Streptomyces sp. NPDC002886]|uniref:RICIN domain-containing protein n=1 Tax=Streptomyces sp. NPDC002886 TaxID=3364667 RepID=UPI00368A6390
MITIKRAKSLRNLLTVAGVAGLLLAAVPASSASAAIPGHTIRNFNSGKCMEVADWRTDNGAPVRQWDCTGGANQNWALIPQGGSWYKFVNEASGKCLEIADWRTDYGAPARQWDCTGGANQQWRWAWSDRDGDGIYTQHIWNRESLLVLEIPAWRTDNGAPVTQWGYNYSPNFNQEWL